MYSTSFTRFILHELIRTNWTSLPNTIRLFKLQHPPPFVLPLHDFHIRYRHTSQLVSDFFEVMLFIDNHIYFEFPSSHHLYSATRLMQIGWRRPERNIDPKLNSTNIPVIFSPDEFIFGFSFKHRLVKEGCLSGWDPPSYTLYLRFRQRRSQCTKFRATQQETLTCLNEHRCWSSVRDHV